MPNRLITSSAVYTRPKTAEFWIAALIMNSAASSSTDSTASGATPVK